MVLFAFAAIYLIWGSSFLAIRLAVDSIPPLLMMSLRCLAAGSLMLLWAAVRGERTTWRTWGHASVAGALMFACAYGALAWAETRLASGVAALLVATAPFWIAVFEYGRKRTFPAPRMLAGLVIGLGGVALLVLRGQSSSLTIVPALVVLVGEIAWVAGALYARPPRLPQSLALRAGMPLTAGGLLLFVASWVAREFHHFDPNAVSMRSLTALAYLILFGSIVAFSAYAWLMQVAPPTQVGTHAYVNPLIAVVLGSAVAGEPLTPSIGMASAVIAAGVALVLGARPQSKHVSEVSDTSDTGAEPRSKEESWSSSSTKPLEARPGTVQRCSRHCAA